MKFFVILLILVLSIIYITECKKVKEGKQETSKTEEKKKVESKKSNVGENKKKLKEKENKIQKDKPDKELKKKEVVVVETKKSSPKVVEVEEIVKSKKKKQPTTKDEPIFEEEPTETEAVRTQSKKIVKSTKVDVAPEETSGKSKKIAETRKKRQQQKIQDEKQTVSKKQRQKRKHIQEPHAFETCDAPSSQAVTHNECDGQGGHLESNDDVIVTVETSKMTATVEHPHENDVV